MRCPKCHYISFDSNDRCRNCGYEFSLSADAALEPLDLPIQTGDEALGPLEDFSLTDLDPRPSAAPTPPPRTPASEPAPSSRARAAGAPSRAASGSLDLPLFKDRRIDDDTPLVTAPAVPRTPLSVRRSSPLATRGNESAADEPVLDPDRDAPYEVAARFEPRVPRHTHTETIEPSDTVPSAGALARVLAALIDAVILASVGAVVLYFTLEVCRLKFSELARLPLVPFATFLLLLWGGYFILFTVAGGQTIGKMAARIKVVSVEEEGRSSGRVPLGRAVMRAVGYLVSSLPAGLGFLPGLFGADRRAVHDRLADTRVVKA